MAITFNEISQLVARFGNSVVNEEANMAAPTIGKGIIKKEKQSGTVGIVNVKSGGLGSTQFIADGGPLPSGSNVSITQTSYHPKAIFSRLSVPRISALTAVSKQDGVNLVKEQMQSVGEDLGRILGRSLFNTTLGSLSAGGVLVAGNNETTFTCNELSGYREGCAIEGLEDSTGTPVPLFAVVTNINHATNTITADVFIDALHQVPADDGTNCTSPVVTAVSPRIQGTGSTGVDAMVSLLDAASSTIDAGNIGTAGNYSELNGATGLDTFTGNSVTSAAPGTLALADMDAASATTKVRSGKDWSHLIMNSLTLEKYLTLLTANRQFVSGTSNLNSNNLNATYQGKPIVVDENIAEDKILYFSDKDVKLAEWRPFGPDYDGKDAAMVSDTNFVYDTQLFGMHNIRMTRRNALVNYTV